MHAAKNGFVPKRKRSYIYLVRRRSDGELFVTYGNFKNSFNRPVYLVPFVPDEYPYGVETPFGNVKNYSCNIKYDSRYYTVIRQAVRPCICGQEWKLQDI